MRSYIAKFLCATLLAVPSVSLAQGGPAHLTTISSELAHGGGCRKSSPPGQCCHMQKSVGKVHCH